MNLGNAIVVIGYVLETRSDPESEAWFSNKYRAENYAHRIAPEYTKVLLTTGETVTVYWEDDDGLIRDEDWSEDL